MTLPTSAEADPNFRRQFFRLAIVNILSNLMVPLAGLIDVAFLGHLAEIRHLAGVALATILFNYIYWSFGFLRMGTTGTTAQAVGRQDYDEVWLTGGRNGLLAVAIALTLLVLQAPLREIGFALLSATPEVKAAGISYYNALIWGAPATLLNFVFIGWFLGRGEGMKVLLLSVVGNSSNVILNYLLIVQWGWASTGAGWATGLSQYLMLLVGTIVVSREVEWHRVKAIAPQLFNPAALKAAFILNTDILIRTFALVTTFSVFTNLSSALGTTVLATNTLLLQVISLAAYFIDGLAFATESFAGMFHAQGVSAKLVSLVKLSGVISLGFGLAFAIGAALFPVPLFSLLTNHADVLNRIGNFVWWLLPVLGFSSIAYMLDGYFLGLTQGRILRQSTLAAALLGFAPVAAIAWHSQSSQMLWLAMTSFMAARAISLAIHVPRSLK